MVNVGSRPVEMWTWFWVRDQRLIFVCICHWIAYTQAIFKVEISSVGMHTCMLSLFVEVWYQQPDGFPDNIIQLIYNSFDIIINFSKKVELAVSRNHTWEPLVEPHFKCCVIGLIENSITLPNSRHYLKTLVRHLKTQPGLHDRAETGLESEYSMTWSVSIQASF